MDCQIGKPVFSHSSVVLRNTGTAKYFVKIISKINKTSQIK